MESFTPWYLFLRILTMDSKDIVIFLFGLSCLLQYGALRDQFTQLPCSVNDTAEYGNCAISVVHVPVPSRCVYRYSRDQLLDLNPGGAATTGDGMSDSCSISGSASPILVSSPLPPGDTVSLCQRLHSVGVHSRHLPCFHKPAKKAHRGWRRKPRLRNGAVLPTTNCKSRSRSLSDSPSSSHVRIALFNAHSVGPDERRIEIAEFIQDNDLDFLFVTETWLKESGDEGKCDELAPAGYKSKSFPRPSHGGGIAVVFRESLASHVSFSTKLPFHHPSYEAVNVTFAISRNTIHFLCIYRPPPSPKNKLTDAMFFPEFHELLDFCNGLNGLPVILGDINFHFNKPNHPSTVKLVDILNQFRFTQSVSEPTHEAGNILDWIMHRPEDRVVTVTMVTQTLSSDHYCVICELSAQRLPPSSVFKTVRSLRHLDKSAFSDDLQTVLAEPVSADQLDKCLRATLDRHAPASKRRVRPEKTAAWYLTIRAELRDAKQQRRRAEKQWLRTGLTVHKQIFNIAKRAVTKMVKKAKSAFIVSQIADTSSSKKLFSICGRLCGRSKPLPLPTAYPLSQLPDIFCDYFMTKVCDIRSKLDSSPSQPIVNDERPNDITFSAFSPVTESHLKKIILNSKPTTCPLDPIPTDLFIECLDVLLPSLTNLINASLASGIVPSLFKTAVVRPLLKKSSLDPNNLKNYRPVSNLSFLSKVLEKVVLEQLWSHLDANDLISPSQSAYRPNHSTETALIKVTNDILSALDSGNVSVLTLLDLSAAFDTIDHSILLQRLSSLYGISGSALDWFFSYLSGRTLSVLVNNSSSKYADLSFGVPQGSVLGPVLFILYTKPLSSLIMSHSISFQSFADDTQLYSSSRPDQVVSTIETIESCILDVKQWMTSNKLKLNDDKTEALLLTKKTTDRHTLPSSIQIGTVDIVFSDSARNLGYSVSSDMSLDKHVSLICRSAYFEIHRIGLIRQYLSVQLTNTLMCAFVLSKLDYCNSLLAGCPSYLIEKLQKVQNSAARLVLKVSKRHHATPLLKRLHWLPIKERINYKLCTICFSFFLGTAPTYISEIISAYTPSRHLRSSTDDRLLCIQRTRTKTYGQRTFAYTAATQWNSLPKTVRHLETTVAFKRAIKTYLFRKYFE